MSVTLTLRHERAIFPLMSDSSENRRRARLERLSAEERQEIARMGGLARAVSMTAQERRDSARKASKAAQASMTAEQMSARARAANAKRWAGHRKKAKARGGDSASA